MSPIKPSRRAFIETFGCQMNDLDSGKMRALLQDAGYERALQAEEADVILINTCSVREKPAHKVRSLLGRYRLLKNQRPDLILGLAGCYAQQEKGKLLDRYPFLDLVFGPDAIPQVVDMVGRARSERVLDARFHDRQDYPFVNHLAAREEGEVTAFVTIMKGCDNVCSFCIVPYTRGREISRSPGEVVEEVRRLAGEGVREVTLLGQNVNSYGGVPGAFPQLIWEVAVVPGIARIRFTTSNPWDLDEELVRCFAEVPALAPYLHLPVQSGSDRMLSLMRRKHDREFYLDLVRRLRQKRGDLSLSTDIIVGHPGETEEDFLATLDLLEAVRYDFIYSFKYSPRPHTTSVKLLDDVPEEVKTERLARVQSLQAPFSAVAMEALVGTVQEILVEGSSRNDKAWQTGRTPGNKIVNFPAPERVRGQLLSVRITGAFPHSLKGEVVTHGDEDPAFLPGSEDGEGESPAMASSSSLLLPILAE